LSRTISRYFSSATDERVEERREGETEIDSERDFTPLLNSLGLVSLPSPLPLSLSPVTVSLERRSGRVRERQRRKFVSENLSFEKQVAVENC
jgi:hypothetical protein